MYNVSSISLQNIYAPSATVKLSSKNDFGAAIGTVFAPSAVEKYAQTDTSVVIAENFYDTLAEQAKTSAEKLAKYDFSDMYVRSTAHQYKLSESDRRIIKMSEYDTFYYKVHQKFCKSNEAAKEAGCILVPIGPGELPKFMDDIMQGLSDGMPLAEILQNKVEEFKKTYHTEGLGTDRNDLVWINPANGEVVDIWEKSRVADGYDDFFVDADAAVELADDLATFLRYAVFPQEGDDSERVESLISYIKDKQAYANYDRYIFDLDMDESVDNDTMAERIIDNLVAAGILKSEEDDEEEEEEAVDELLKAIKERLKTWKEEMIGRKKSGLTVEEVEEILSELKVHNTVTAK